MKAFEQLERLKLINRLIKEERTGTPEEFADRLCVSASHLYRCIDGSRRRHYVIWQISQVDGRYSRTAVIQDISAVINYVGGLIPGHFQ